MKNFSYVQAREVSVAIRERADAASSAYLGGGTNLLDHLRLEIEHPTRLIDVRRVGLDRIEEPSAGALRIDSGVTNTALAYDPRIQRDFPVLAQAILSGASPQLRNMATTGGNLLQRTRCPYFRDGISPCNKRDPGSGCAAVAGFNRSHAILGTSDRCIATHPSDMAVALMALEAIVSVEGPKGRRSIPLAEFYVPYGEDPARENTLQPGELITAVELAHRPWFARSCYFKARDRAEFEFALASAAVAVDVDGGRVRDCRIALGGVGTKPWRALAAEKALRGTAVSEDAFRAAADAELRAAVPQTHNGFKIELCRQVVVQALHTATA